jgi:MFS family permease
MDERLERDRRRTLLLVSLASIMERADEALLPAVYREVGAELHATPAGLGALSLCRSVVQAACYPLAAYAAARHNRAHVIAVGAFLWAAATFLVGISDTFLQVRCLRNRAPLKLLCSWIVAVHMLVLVDIGDLTKAYHSGSGRAVEMKIITWFDKDAKLAANLDSAILN